MPLPDGQFQNQYVQYVQYLCVFFFLVDLVTRVSYIYMLFWYSPLLGVFKKFVDDQNHQIPSQIIQTQSRKPLLVFCLVVFNVSFTPSVLASGLWHVQLSEGSPIRCGPFVGTRRRVNFLTRDENARPCQMMTFARLDPHKDFGTHQLRKV